MVLLSNKASPAKEGKQFAGFTQPHLDLGMGGGGRQPAKPLFSGGSRKASCVSLVFDQSPHLCSHERAPVEDPPHLVFFVPSLWC